MKMNKKPNQKAKARLNVGFGASQSGKPQNSNKSKTDRIYTNHVYEIVSIGDKSLTIVEPREGTEMTFKFNMISHFELS